jgi:hypothetical protein
MTVKKPDTTSDNLMLIIGQLLEATKAAAEGLKSVGQEVQGNAKAIIAVSQTVKMIETKVGELNKIVADVTYAGNLVGVTSVHSTEIKALKEGMVELEKTLTELKALVSTMGTSQTQVLTAAKTTKNIVWETAKVVGWIATTAIALYAALAGK